MGCHGVRLVNRDDHDVFSFEIKKKETETTLRHHDIQELNPVSRSLFPTLYLWDVTEFVQGANRDDHDVFSFGRMGFSFALIYMIVLLSVTLAPSKLWL